MEKALESLFLTDTLEQYLEKLIQKNLISHSMRKALEAEHVAGQLYVAPVIKLFKQSDQHLLILDAVKDVQIRLRESLVDFINIAALLPKLDKQYRHQLTRFLQLEINTLNKLQLIERADKKLQRLLPHDQSAETLGLQASNLKSRAASETQCADKKKRLLREAQSVYQQVFEQTPEQYFAWHGTNAASILFILHDFPACYSSVNSIIAIADKKPQLDVWQKGGLAEVLLLSYLMSGEQGVLAQSKAFYRDVVCNTDNREHVRSLLRNLQLIEQHVQDEQQYELIVDLIREIFPRTTFVTVFSDETCDYINTHGASSDHFIHVITTPSDSNSMLANDIQTRVNFIDVILPYPWPEYREKLAISEPCKQRWDEILDMNYKHEGGCEVRCWTLSHLYSLNNDTMHQYLFNCIKRFTNWQRSQYDIAISETIEDPVFESSALFIDRMHGIVGLKQDDTHALKTAFFSDIQDFSKFNELEVKLFFEQVLPHVADIINRHASDICQREGWGDAMNLVFNHPNAAIQCSLELVALLEDPEKQYRWRKAGLNKKIKMRIALESAPLLNIFDPIENKMVFTGNFMTRAARIEPIAEPNKIYCGLGTFLLCQDGSNTNFTFNYLGIISLSKSFGGENIFTVEPAPKQQLP